VATKRKPTDLASVPAKTRKQKFRGAEEEIESDSDIDDQ